MDEQILNAADKAKKDAENAVVLKKEEEIRNLPTTLLKCVSSWGTLRNGTLKHKYYYDYYPHYLYKNKATASIKHTWDIVWGFECYRGDISHPHFHWALGIAINLVEETLRSTFGSMTEYLTLVCPKWEKVMGYEYLPEKVCQDLKMTNAYPHIHVVEDGREKNDDKKGYQTVSNDESFFKGKFVVLFNNVLTTGKSLEIERKRMESLGAKVICATSIAQTTH